MALGDLCTLADVKLAHGLTETTYDAAIAQYITEASDAVHAHCQPRILVKEQTGDDRFYRGANVVDGELLIDDLSDVPTAVAFVDRLGVVTWPLIIADDVVTLPRNRRAGEPITALMFRPSAPPVNSAWEVKVTGIWGWPEIPGRATTATVEAVRHWLRTTQAVSTQAPETDDAGHTAIAALPARSKQTLRSLRGIRVG